MIKVALVSCCKGKNEYPAQAKDLYTSDLFKKTREYVEKNYDSWNILSAYYLVVNPDGTLPPYEYTLTGKSQDIKKKWSVDVSMQLIRNYDADTHEFVIFAGDDYRKYLVPLLEKAGFKVNVPLKGLGIGQQKSWLKKAVK